MGSVTKAGLIAEDVAVVMDLPVIVLQQLQYTKPLFHVLEQNILAGRFQLQLSNLGLQFEHLVVKCLCARSGIVLNHAELPR